MKYLVTNLVEKSYVKDGVARKFYAGTLTDEAGVEYQGVGLFDATPETVEVEGEVSKNDKGYWNFKSTKKAAGASFMQNQKLELEHVRKENIKEVQDRKEMSIAYFNSLNAAIKFVEAFTDKDKLNHPDVALAEKFESVIAWQKKFYNNWMNFHALPDNEKTTPF